VVPVVDGTAIQEVWPLAMKAVRPDCGVCLLVLGPGLAPSRELASTIAEQRRRIRPGQGVPVVVPVDTRDWTPLLPPETPSGVRKLLERLKLGI
jgi:hypothetical protein